MLNQSAANYVACCDSDTFRFVVQERCCISYVKWSGIDQPKLLKEVDPKDWVPAYAMISEYCFQWTDFITRTTGRLTKIIRIVDLVNMSVSKNANARASFRDGKALNSMEDYYPQMLQALWLTEAPFWIEGPWMTIRPLMPKRVLQKFDFLEPSRKPKDLERFQQFVDIDKIPKHYGGNFPHWPDDTKPPQHLLG